MYVCVCNAVSERAIHEAVDEGARTFGDLQARTGCATTCGCCEAVAEQVLEQRLRAQRPHLVRGSGTTVLAMDSVSQ